jgi:predicted dehydrogenase
MPKVPPRTRRDFLKLAGATTTAVASSRLHVLHAQDPPGAAGARRVGLATIGLGIQGFGDTKAALKTAGVDLVGVADLYDGRLTLAREAFGETVAVTRDYKEILARPDVDAVIVATPDHWHMPIAVEALAAGKHVYVEKPMVQFWDEGQKIVDAQKASGKVVQVGSQRASAISSLKARDLLAKGAIGELNMVDAWLSRNSAQGAWQYFIPPDASPATVDWDRFLGRAPKRAFDPVRFFRWRNYQDYGTGVAGDLFVHLFTALHVITRSLGPTRVMTTGGLRYWNDGRDVPDVMLGLFDYPKTDTHPAFNLTIRVNFADGGGESSGLDLIGSEGVMSVSGDVTLSRRPRSTDMDYAIRPFPKAMQKRLAEEHRARFPTAETALQPSSAETYRPAPDYSASEHHFQNFFESIRSGAPMVEDAVFGLRAAGPAVVSNLSYFEGRPYAWDPVAMKATPARG